MKGLFLILLFLGGCATSKPQRKIASESVKRLGRVDLSSSIVQMFPSVRGEDQLWYYFYLQLKDADGNFIDCDPNEIDLKTETGKKLSFTYERSFAGRYYLSLEKTQDVEAQSLNFFIQGKRLRKQFKLLLKLPSRENSRITIIENDRNKISFRLFLRDKLNHPVETPDSPEILMDGQGMIEDLKHVKEGVWEFSVIYPDENQIMYFSVRAMGVFFSNLHRYQHVEK